MIHVCNCCITRTEFQRNLSELWKSGKWAERLGLITLRIPRRARSTLRAEIRDDDPSGALSELSSSGSVAVSVAAVSADESLEFLVQNLSGFGSEVMGLKDMTVVFEVRERKLLRRMWMAVVVGVDGTTAVAMVGFIALPVAVSDIGVGGILFLQFRCLV